MESPILFDPKIHNHLIPQLVTVHSRCITEPTHTIATFFPPLNTPLMQTWWETRCKEISTGGLNIIMQMAPNPETGVPEVAGTVTLTTPFTQTGPFRAWVEKLLVLPEHRGKGIMGAMMRKLDEVALAKGKTLLVLDTERGSPAELIYPKFGYIYCGCIPDFEISPLDGSLKEAVFFYKKLSTPAQK